MKNECAIVQDLHPLYIEDMLSADSATFVREHLEACPKCRAALAEAQKEQHQQEIDAWRQTLENARVLQAVRRRLRRRIIAAILITALCLLAVGGAVSYYVNLPQKTPVNYSMQAYEVDAEGEIKDATSLEILGEILQYRDGKVCLAADFKIPDTFRYDLWVSQDHPTYRINHRCPKDSNIFVSSISACDRELPNTYVDFWFALDPDNECIIMHWRNGPTFPDSYLVASTNPNVIPKEILDHFDWFVDMVNKAHGVYENG